MYRHHPQTLKVKELVESGAIGQLRSSAGGSPSPCRIPPMCGSPGNGWWRHLGCRLLPHQLHPHRRGRGPGGGLWLAGDGRPAWTWSSPDDALPERRPGPVRQRVPFAGTDVDGVSGQRRRAQPDQLLQARHEVADQPLAPDGTTETITVPGLELYIGEVEDMYDAVVYGKPTRVTLADTRGNVATILALLQSAREGSPVTL